MLIVSVILPRAICFESLSLNVSKNNFKILSSVIKLVLWQLCLHNQAVAFCSYSLWLSKVIFLKKICKSLYTPAENPNQLGLDLFFKCLLFALHSWNEKYFYSDLEILQLLLVVLASNKFLLKNWSLYPDSFKSRLHFNRKMEFLH